MLLNIENESDLNNRDHKQLSKTTSGNNQFDYICAESEIINYYTNS